MNLSNGMLHFGKAPVLSLARDGIQAVTSCADAVDEKAFSGLSGNTCFIENSIGELTLSECGVPAGLAPFANDNLQLIKLSMKLVPAKPCNLTDFSVRLDFLAGDSSVWQAAKEGFHWIPGIKHEAHDVAGDHLFRSPVAILSAGATGAALIPILDGDNGIGSVNRYLDLRFDENKAPFILYGARPLELSGHVYYKPTGKPFAVDAQGIELSFYLLLFTDASKFVMVQTITEFLWAAYAHKYEKSLLPQTVPFDAYAKYGNGMAMQYLWEEGPEPQTGGICLSTFRRDDGAMRGREYADDIWFHAWFNNMRTAMELACFGQRMNKPEWVKRSRAVAACLLTAPQKEGIFPTIYAPRDGGWICSSEHGGGRGLYSLPDCSWSAIWLRKYSNEQEALPGAEGFLGRYRDFLYRHQNASGGFPCWVSSQSLEPDARLNDSASGALSVWFMGEEILCGAVRADEMDKAAAVVKDGADHLLKCILPEQRFEDFELYYSCSPKPLNYYDAISCLYAQNTLAMQWCAEALRVAYQITGQQKYLEGGTYCMNILCLYQQVWRHPGLDFYGFGGFGVMNTDGEWNDARQAQFAETLSNYFELTGNAMYLRRAVAAMRAGFALMAIEENKNVCPRNYRGAAVNFEVHGNSAENYGHSGVNERSYQSGFHWGTGSALVTAARLKERYNDLFIDVENAVAIGMDGIVVKNVLLDGREIRLSVECLPGVENFGIKTSKSPSVGVYSITIEGFAVQYDAAGSVYSARVCH